MLRCAPDLIEAGDPYQCAWSALEARRRLGIQALAFYHSDLPQLAGQRLGRLGRLAAERYVARLYRQFDLVLAPSRCSVAALQSLGVRNVRRQALGVDTVVFHPRHRDISLRQRLGVPPDARLLVYAGRFTREKNLDALVDAVGRLGPPYWLLLIGAGKLETQSARVVRLPFQSEPERLAACVAACDLFVHPGEHETFGLVVLEAMACGVPVLGVARGGVAELVDAGSGLLVERGEAAMLAEGIAHLFDRDLPSIGRQARQKAERDHDWDCVMPQLLRHYQRLAGAGCDMVFEPLSLPP